MREGFDPLIRYEHLDEHAFIEARGLRLVFAWQNDRWAHRIELKRSTECDPIAQSMEHSVEMLEGAGILSPAFQDLHLQENTDSVVALLVGNHGQHHFSATFESRSRETSRGFVDTLTVDVADRYPQVPPPLSSSYRMNYPDIQLVDGDPSQCNWRLQVGLKPQFAQIGLESISEGQPSLTAPLISLLERSPTVTDVQIHAPRSETLRTHRWQYRWVLRLE